MHHHHPETNPHFIRLQSQDQQHGGPPDPWRSPPPQQDHQASPPQRHHGQRDPVGPLPVVQIRSRGQQHSQRPQSPPLGGRGAKSKLPSARPMPLSPEEPLPPRHGQHRDGHRGPSRSTTRPLLLSPEETRPPPLDHIRHDGQPRGKPLPANPVEPTPPQYGGQHHQRANQHSQGPRIPPPKKTNPVMWSAAVCCAIFWVIIILGGLIVLIVYLVYRPHSPHFDISSANLNAAYLDMGFLLNADLTLLANFTNPSKKGSVDFSYVTFELYYDNTLIATEYFEPFSAAKAHSMFANVHLVSSQVRLLPGEIQQLRKQIDSNAVKFNVKGTFHARSNLGSLLRYSYWLYSHCTITVAGPPTGVLRERNCNTKR